MFQYLQQHWGQSEKPQDTLNMKHSSWSPDDKFAVHQTLPYSVLESKLDLSNEVMMNIPHYAH